MSNALAAARSNPQIARDSRAGPPGEDLGRRLVGRPPGEERVVRGNGLRSSTDRPRGRGEAARDERGGHVLREDLLAHRVRIDP